MSNGVRRGAAETGLVLLGASALAVIATWPLTRDLGSVAPAFGDPLGAIAWLRWLADGEGFTVVGQTQITQAGAPFGWDQGNGVNIQWLIPYGSAYLATLAVGEVAAYNLVALSGLAISGAAMYLLVRRLGASVIAAAWAGIVFTIFPWHLAAADYHASLAHLEGFPLLVLATLAWRDRPGGRTALMVAAAVALIWMTSAYYGIMGMIALVPLLLLAALSEPRSGLPRRLLGAAGAYAGALVVVLIVFGISRLGEGERGLGTAARSLAELQVYGARWWEWVTPPSDSALLGSLSEDFLSGRQHGSNPTETALYVGLLTLALAIGWLAVRAARWRRLDPRTRFLATALPSLVLAGLVCALPTPLEIGAVSIPTPARLIAHVVPEFRVSSRFIVLVMTGLVPLAALGLDALSRGVARGVPSRAARPTVAVIGSLAIALSAAELWTDRPPTVPLGGTPAEYAALESLPPGHLVEYPYLAPEDPASLGYLVWQRVHGRSLINGGVVGSPGDLLRSGLLDPLAPQTAPGLAALGTVGLIDHAAQSRPEGLGPGYRLVTTTPSGVTVWRVVARPGVAMGFGAGFGLAEPARPGLSFRWLQGETGRIHLFAPTAGVYRASFELGSFARDRRVRVVGATRSAVVHGGLKSRAEVLLDLPAGRSTIVLRPSPGLQRLPDGRLASITISDWTITAAPTAPAARAVDAAGEEGE